MDPAFRSVLGQDEFIGTGEVDRPRRWQAPGSFLGDVPRHPGIAARQIDGVNVALYRARPSFHIRHERIAPIRPDLRAWARPGALIHILVIKGQNRQRESL